MPAISTYSIPNASALPHTNGVSLSTWLTSPSVSNEQKQAFLTQLSHEELNDLYEHQIAAYGLHPPSASRTTSTKSHDLSEETYMPTDVCVEPSPAPNAPSPIYAPYAGLFATSEAAKMHRKRIRVAPKSLAPDVERVKRYGRPYWVRRIYEAMIDITCINDGKASIHRQRFARTAMFKVADLEATAHHIFDAALAVHERGWNRPSIYHKKVVRGKLTDVSEKSVETRLARLCIRLKQNKATVDDAIRGGVTLALLCDNPEARYFTKASNNTGNKKRGEKLKLVKDYEVVPPGKGSD